ncbi:hypothetical protein COHA_007981 [Chlorella ohadii]|uniref:t-SNARE coiled-coil homology domain-containing protein n=1 Tax=Chlorella ohadii TaxID=2649997 RepID=A0AAD5GZE3_9CHLO|nr:hypothetical protein COHA_007981 [Chlorella ohadii]
MGYEDARPDSARENGGLVEPPRDHDTPYLSAGERRLLEAGKAEHRETTATAKRALQLAEKTADVAQNTLVELHRQGQQLENAELGMDQVQADVKEANMILKFMRRWCCFQCCDCCDPHADLERTRKKRVALTKQQMSMQRAGADMHYGAKQQSVARVAREHDPAYGGSEPAARQELMEQAAAVKAARRGAKATDIGLGLPDEDRQEIQRETDQQDEILDRIGDAVSGLHAMAGEMQMELAEQAPRIDRLGDRAKTTHDQLGNLARQARRI